MNHKISEKQNIIIGCTLLLFITFLICFILVKCNPVILNPLYINEPNILDIIVDGQVVESFELDPIDKKMNIEKYIDYDLLDTKKIIKDKQGKTLNYDEISYDFIVNTDDIISSAYVESEIQNHLNQYDKKGNYKNLTKDQYLKISNGQAYDYTSYCTYYIHVLGHYNDVIFKENIEMDAFFKAMADYTTIDDTSSEYQDFIYHDLTLNVGKDAKNIFISSYYQDITDDLTEAQLNYLIFQFSDQVYKRQYISNKIIEEKNLYPTTQEINDFLQIESKRLNITEDEFIATMMSKEEIKIYLSNIKLSEFIEEKINENKK